MTQIAVQNLWTYIESLNLSRRNRKWLAERLITPVAKEKKNGLDAALDDIREGRVYHADSVEDMFKDILGEDYAV